MPKKKNRLVLLCQQFLALGTVAALATPAMGVVTLDIVRPDPEAAENRAATGPAAVALVASRPVEPEVTQVPLEGVDKAGLEALTPRDEVLAKSTDDLAALSAPTDVDGFATVGVTWKPQVHLDDDEVSVSVRSLEDGEWSTWQQIQYDSDHGPDPESREARRARQGTDPIVVGDVDEVQVKIETADGEVPAGAQLAVIDPKATPAPTVEGPAIDTADLPAGGAVALSSSTTGTSTSSTTSTTGDDPALPATDPAAAPAEGVLTGAVGVTPKPQIFSRAQWGADERLRDKSSLAYSEVHAGFVHHTVNANGYTRSQVPSLIRGIYAYHTRTKGWSDIGYNFIVDRFGRIWEGRYGGVDRPVVGAHTLDYNENSFAMSALGNFEKARPSSAMLDAYGRLFAWKLSLHGVSAASPKQWVGQNYFRAVNGHRDAGTTACPGRFLYAQLGTIRALAAKYQAPFTPRTRSTNLAGSPWPDLVVRDKATKKAYLVRTGGQTNFQRRVPAAVGWKGMDLVAAARDLTGDGVPDMVARNAATKVTSVYPGTAQGGLGTPVSGTDRFADAEQLVGALDMTGDGRSDLLVQETGSANLWAYPGNGNGGFRQRELLSSAWAGYNLTASAGDLDGDGRNDLVARAGKTLYLVPGTARGLGTAVALPGGWGRFALVSGAGDVTNDGRADLLAKDRRSRLVSVFPGDGRGGFGFPLGPFDQFKDFDFLAASGQLAGDPSTDLVGRDAMGRVFVFPNNAAKNVEAVVDTGLSLSDTNLILNVGDWNGDGYGDLMTRATATGSMFLRAGDGRGGFGTPVLAGSGWGGVGLVAAVGDITGDGYPDLMGQPARKAMRIYPGNGTTGFLAGYVAHSAISSNRHTGLGLWDSDGSPDSLTRRADGTLQLYRGNGPGGLLSPKQVRTGANPYDWLQGVGDATGDGRPDVVAREQATGRLWLLPGTSTGFGGRRLLADGFGAYDLSS